MTDTDTVNDTAATDTPADASSESLTVDQTRKPWQFKPGNRANPHGRPRKGESLPELLAKEYEKSKKKLVKAAVNRALRDDQVGNRAFNDGLDRVYGKVADEMHLTVGDDPLAELLQRIAGRREPLYIEEPREEQT